MLIDRRLAQNIQFFMAGVILLLISLGILNLYSAALNVKVPGMPIYMKQVIWAVAGIACMTIFALLDYRLLQRASYPLYILSLILLAITLVFGKAPTGAIRWINVGVFSFQPSELAKIAIILALARYFDIHWRPEGFGLKDLLVPLVLVAMPAALIIKQPDLGTAIVVLLMGFSMIIVARIKPRDFIVLLAGACALLPLFWFTMKGYQKRRLLSFFNPTADTLGGGYHQLQSKIAVGSGRFWGKGFLKGTQTQLHFLPEQHTDFAFSVWAEEWGFIGSAILLGLFAYLVLTGLEISSHARDRFGMLVAVGVVAVLFWQVMINVGMVTGMLPVVGVPLPFISYGGSSLLTVCMGMGLLLSIGMRRHMF